MYSVWACHVKVHPLRSNASPCCSYICVVVCVTVTSVLAEPYLTLGLADRSRPLAPRDPVPAGVLPLVFPQIVT